MTSAPTTPMFKHCGGDTNIQSKKSAGVSTEVGEFVSGVVQQIGMAMKNPNGPPNSASPAKVIDNRSKCYKQLGELKSLKDSNLLSEDEYMSERQAIMATLRSLSS